MKDGRLRELTQLTISIGNAEYHQIIVVVFLFIALCNAAKMAITAFFPYWSVRTGLSD